MAAGCAGLVVLAVLFGHWKAGQRLPKSALQTQAADGANYAGLIKLIQESIATNDQDDQPGNIVEFNDSKGEPLSARDRNSILDSVLRHALTDPELEGVRGFYGTPGDAEFALASSSERPGWPDSYVPDVEGFRFRPVVEGAKVDPFSPPRWGIRLDQFNLSEQSPGLCSHPIEITIFNAGGTGDDHSIINGGCSVYYGAVRDGECWTVTYAGSFDP